MPRGVKRDPDFVKRKEQAERAQLSVPPGMRPGNSMESWLPGGSNYTGIREQQIKGEEPEENTNG